MIEVRNLDGTPAAPCAKCGSLCTSDGRCLTCAASAPRPRTHQSIATRRAELAASIAYHRERMEEAQQELERMSSNGPVSALAVWCEDPAPLPASLEAVARAFVGAPDTREARMARHRADLEARRAAYPASVGAGYGHLPMGGGR